MPAEDNRSGAQASLGKSPADHYSLDTLAKGLASEGVSRGQALRMIGGTLAGAALALFFPGVARGQQDGPVNHGPNGPVDFGSQGAVDGKANATCPGKLCNRDADCPSRCPCSLWIAGGRAFYACGSQL
jgi:hypothetical protein